jgi:transposase
MSRLANMPNGENCSLAELNIAAGAVASRRSHVRMMAIKALLLGGTHDYVAELYGVSRRTLSTWVNRFNSQGIDGLIEQGRSGRPAKIKPEKADQFRELIDHPDLANETHWTARKFHGYLTRELDQEIGYSTVVRWLHDQGFALKVPRPWPNGQDQDKRKSFLEWLRGVLEDSETDAWYLDETGIEGDPRPRRRWAQKGEKILLAYEGTHIRMSATGAVCPRTGEFYALMFSHSDTEIFQIFLDHANDDICFDRKRNLLIMDNASWHKNKSIRWGRFEPVFLPPYSPDLNPIERLWLLMKTEWFSSFFTKTQNDLIDRLCDALNWITDRKLQNQKTCANRKEL